MRDLYSDDYESLAGAGGDRLIPDGIRKLSGAAVFLGLIAVMGLWSYRLGTRDAGEVPIIRAMEGPVRVQPEEPGGLQAAHQGLEVNAVLAGRPAPIPREAPPARPAPEALAAEDASQGELVLSAPAAMAERVMAGDAGSPMTPDDGPLDADPTETPSTTPVILGDAAPEPASPADTRPRNRPANLVIARSRPAPAQAFAAKSAASAPGAAAPPKAAVKAEVTKVAVRETAAPATGARLVQLGAFDSEDITRKAWSQLVARNGDLLGSKQLFVERTTANARVFYRLRVAGFQTADDTRKMCDALRARGVACIPVTLQ